MKKTIGEYFPSKFLKAQDIKGETPLTISDLKEETLREKSDPQPVLYFEETDKGLVLNLTNSNKLIQILSSDNPHDWFGRKITLITALVSFKGEEVPAIRVKAFVPKKADANASASYSLIDECLNDVDWLKGRGEEWKK